MDRRKFLGLVGAAGATVLAVATADRFFLRSSSATAKSGNWSDPKTWGGHVPGAKDTAVISGKVTLDTDPTVGGIVIEPGGELTFDPGASRTLKSSGNVVVQGKLTMKPSTPSVVHKLMFIDVNESKFLGGDTETPLNSDVGLWVMDSGLLQLTGSPKTAWTRNPNSATGWRAADEIAVSPVKKGDYSFTTYTGANVPSKLPKWDDYTAEALNLTRNVVIEGADAAHRAHVFVRNTAPVAHTISNVLFRYLGPRGGHHRTKSGGTLGRYPLHLHMGGMNNSGLVVDSCVVRDSGNHAYWPHMTDGITFRNCVAYSVEDTAFGWDNPDDGNDIAWDSCVAALILLPGPATMTGFLLGNGKGNSCTDCTAVGVQGKQVQSGFYWAEKPDAEKRSGVWTFTGCRAHNNESDGIYAWQNDRKSTHVIKDFSAYHNGTSGIEHGAYKNAYQYIDVTLKENGTSDLFDHAVSGADPGPLLFQSVSMDGRGSTPYSIKLFGHVVPPDMPMRFLDCTLAGYVTNAIQVDQSKGRPGTYDFVHTKVGETGRDLAPEDFTMTRVVAGTVIRVQSLDDSSAFQITSAGMSKISPFWTS